MACGAREVHRRGRRLPGDLRARARSTCSTGSTTPSSTTSRSSRSSASRRASSLGGELPAGGRPASRCSRTSRASTCRWRRHPAQVRAPRRPRGADRARASARSTCVIVPNDLAGAEAVEEPPRAHGTVHSGVGYTRPRVVPARRRTCARAAEILNAGETRRDPRRARARSAPTDEVIEVAELLGAGVAKALLGKRRAARRPALRDRLDRPARHAAELGADAGLRHAADGRLELPVLGVPARGGPGARRADRHRRAACSASAIRWRSTSSATRARRCARCCRCCERKADRSWREQIEDEVERLVGASLDDARA